MDISELILEVIKQKGEVGAKEIIKKTGFSRQYINRFFQQLRDEGIILLVGKANKAKYVSADKKVQKEVKEKILDITIMLKNDNLQEDKILSHIKNNTGIFLDLEKNVSDIMDYAFSEMLNNAIEHSESKTINIIMKKIGENVYFCVSDKGIGIFNNIMKKRNLNNELEAVQDLLKGRQTTMPELHSGEGIFFTSKMADLLIIKSSRKKLIYDNLQEDIFVKDVKNCMGTKVFFTIDLESKKNLNNVFNDYTGSSFEFSKTEVAIRMYKISSEFISRSQARRVVSGLEKFKTIVLDFGNVETVGQGFADEIFRVWQSGHPSIEIIIKNANENVQFMIKRAKANG